jgi:hypothetical protein
MLKTVPRDEYLKRIATDPELRTKLIKALRWASEVLVADNFRDGNPEEWISDHLVLLRYFGCVLCDHGGDVFTNSSGGYCNICKMSVSWETTIQ